MSPKLNFSGAFIHHVDSKTLSLYYILLESRTPCIVKHNKD